MKKGKDFIMRAAVSVILAAAIFTAIYGIVRVNGKISGYELEGCFEFVRDASGEENDGERLTFKATFCYGELVFEKEYSEEAFEKLDGNETLDVYVYKADGERLVLCENEATEDVIAELVKQQRADENKDIFAFATGLFLIAAGLAVITFFSKHFSLYEKIWFITILIAASVVSVLFPEEDTNGINGLVIMALYLADTFLNILCELLISKQSKWNFLVSVFVEITEIIMYVLLAYRFATIATTLFFWLPIDIVSFVNWHRHPDSSKEELTEVRKLSGIGSVIVIAGIVIWTAAVGYLLSGLDITTDIFGEDTVTANLVCYLDACASAVGIANGIFILLRYREQWIAWYLNTILDGVINVLSGQIVLLVLKVGFLSNTTYGYVKWTRYIKENFKLKRQDRTA